MDRSWDELREKDSMVTMKSKWKIYQKEGTVRISEPSGHQFR